jgi:hypothetical protein
MRPLVASNSNRQTQIFIRVLISSLCRAGLAGDLGHLRNTYLTGGGPPRKSEQHSLKYRAIDA